MYLYNITLQRATGITHAVHGNFSGTKQQEIAVARGKIIELLRPDPNTGKVYTLLTCEAFGIVRSFMPFRLTGSNKDYLIVGSDSGRVVVLEYIPSKNVFEKVQQETFGKSGCRRIVPGQYLAVNPKGRAFMIGAVEKQKLVYIMNRDSQARLTISSPLEAHKSNTLVYHMVGVDVGFDNPLFACIEMDYEDADQDSTGEAARGANQLLTYYELDLGLNHVVRKYSEPLEEHANFLIAVPGGNEGPSGILICSENYITYKNFGDQPDIRCPIPQRRNDLDDPDRGILFVCSASHKTKNLFFFLAQTEQGDIFKINLEVDDDMVTEIKLKYFDTVPVASAMCVLKTGFLFVASEFGNHCLYQIAHLGDDDDEPEFSSAMPLEEGDTFYFAPRPLKNLIEVDVLESLSPVMSCHIADFANEDTPQLAALCGRGPGSTFRLLRHGLEVSEMAKSDLPGNPNAVWTVKRNSEGRLLVGVGNRLRIYDLGKKKLLKKCENKHIPTLINGIYSVGSRIIVTDVQESVHWVRYRPRSDSQLVIFADDTNPRWIVHLAVLDASTVAVSDKFGNVTILRLPPNVIDDIEDDPSGNRALWDRGFLGGASQKCDVLCHFYVGEVVTCLQKATLIPGGSEGIVYSTISGSIGMLVPFASRDAYDFFQHLELHMRAEGLSLVGREHVHYRSQHYPVRNVIDGDLCEIFNSLEGTKQRSIAEEMDKTPSDIAKRLEDIRTRFAF
ncbi:unnamed protein product [Schistosoma margrebowiei]|uniref:DNA damage-binding protein 1 n=1 Tax=Schistosoma margrebowiei TaxID=48269 RepID=A0AA84ZKB7_9TREM|nr:unnamed protein product [Schistosoma margrebowiei]